MHLAKALATRVCSIYSFNAAAVRVILIRYQGRLLLNYKEMHIELGSGVTNDHKILAVIIESLYCFLLYVKIFGVDQLDFHLRKYGVATWTLRHTYKARVCPKLLFRPHHETFGVKAVTTLRLPEKIQDFEVFDADSTGGVGMILRVAPFRREKGDSLKSLFSCVGI